MTMKTELTYNYPRVRHKRRGADFQSALCKSQSAFSLIEMIGVLAVLAILLTILAPSFVRQMDKTAGDQESANLKALGDAFQQSVMRNRYIPSDADWASAVATESGVDIASVTNTPRRQPRFLL